MAERQHRAGSLPVRRAVAVSGLRWAAPLIAVEAGVFLLLHFQGDLTPLSALAGFVVIAAATGILFRLLARNLEEMGLWLVQQERDVLTTPPMLRHWVAGDTIEGLMGGVHGILKARDEHVDQLSAETDRMLDSLPDPLLLLSRTRRVMRMNRAARWLFGEEAIGQDVTRLVRNPALEEAVDLVLGSEPVERIEISVSSGQVERLFSVEIAPMPVAADDSPAVMAMFHDMTELRRTEQMRVDFVANASHEIRSPLATLIGCIETLQGPARDDPDAYDRFLGMMDDQGRRMAQLVEDLLSLSRIELKEHVQPTGSVELGAMLERLASSLAFQAEEKGIALSLDSAADLLPVRGDQGEIEQALYNLMSNAIKYGRHDSRVSVKAGRAETAPNGLRLMVGPLVWVSITDQGEGIAPHHIPRLTERFYRIDTARSREMGGTGLGLAIVKHVLNRHRGELQIASTPGEGSTFTVWLPVVQN